MKSEDLRPNTRGGDAWTVLLLTLCNLIVPLVAYIWGIVRLSQTDRWNKLQKVGLMLILPVLFVGPAILFASLTTSRSSTIAEVSYPASPPATNPARRDATAVSATTFGRSADRTYLDAVVKNVRFEQRNGCLYVGADQVVWSFGTTVRQQPGTTEFEVRDATGRKLAETGTTVHWGGGQVSSGEAETTRFTEKLSTTSNCKGRNDSYWIVGKIVSPRFESDNSER